MPEEPIKKPDEILEPGEPGTPEPELGAIEPGGEPKEPGEPGEPKEPGEPGEPDDKKTVPYSRFSEVYGALKRTERELETFKRGQTREPTPTQPSADKEPQPEDFDDYNNYMKSWNRWDRGQIEAKEKADREQQSEADRQRQIDNKVAMAVAKDAEFLQKAYIPAGLASLVTDSDRFAEIAYHFGEHPEEAQRLLSLPETAAAREIGRLEAKLAGPPQKTTTKAPDPTAPGGGKEEVTKDESRMSTDEWIAERNRSEQGQG